MQPLEIILILTFTVQVAYWVALYFGVAKEQVNVKSLNVPVSVIVCAHNEEENLSQLIPLLRAQHHYEFEIIVVNDCSSDGTLDLLHKESQKDHRLKVVNINHRPDHVNGKKYGLTLGIRAAEYDWVLLTDADCRPASVEWISQMTKSFTDTNSFVLGYSPYYKEKGFLNSFIRFETIVTAIQFMGLANLGNPYMATGRNLAYRKKIFLESKGFSSHINVTGGDDDLFVNEHSTALNTRTALHPKAIVYSHPKKTWREFYHQKIRHLAVGKKYRLGTQSMLAPFMFSWIIFWPSAISGLFTSFWIWVLAVILVRLLAMSAVFHAFNKKSGEEFEQWRIPFLDFIFCFYYLVAAFSALITKRIRWKKT